MLRPLADFAPQCNFRRTLAILPDSTGARPQLERPEGYE
jgi:hypothetical protein